MLGFIAEEDMLFLEFELESFLKISQTVQDVNASLVLIFGLEGDTLQYKIICVRACCFIGFETK